MGTASVIYPQMLQFWYLMFWGYSEERPHTKICSTSCTLVKYGSSMLMMHVCMIPPRGCVMVPWTKLSLVRLICILTLSEIIKCHKGDSACQSLSD